MSEDAWPHSAKTNEAGEVIDERPYYDPETGDRYESPGLATGHPESPHAPIAVVKVKSGKSDDGEGGGVATKPRPRKPAPRKPAAKRKTTAKRKTR